MVKQPLVWMNGLNSQALDFTLIPVRVGFGSGADRLQIYGHFARRNPLAEALLSNAHAVILWRAENGYMSPTSLSDRTQAPTWLYASARFSVKVRLYGDQHSVNKELQQIVSDMERHHSGNWATSEMGARYDKLARGVIAFEADIVDLQIKFKLAQDERSDVRSDLERALSVDHPELAKLVQKHNQEIF